MLFRDVPLWLRRAFAEEKLFHFRYEELAGFGFDWCQSVLVDQRRLVRQPLLPGFFTDVVLNALPKFARVRRIVQALGFFLQKDAINGS